MNTEPMSMAIATEMNGVAIRMVRSTLCCSAASRFSNSSVPGVTSGSTDGVSRERESLSDTLAPCKIASLGCGPVVPFSTAGHVETELLLGDRASLVLRDDTPFVHHENAVRE